ncbi:nucleotide exchange factor GrpE [candidate division KSB1 bacterium]|nr:nucleotide exchange factor GrpE [candidate division KSB1 bacterium]
MSEKQIEINEDAIEETQKEEEVTAKIEEKKSPAEENYLQILQLLKADFDNYKKRVLKEKLELSSFIKSQFIYKLLPIIDDFERLVSERKVDEQNDDQENKRVGAELIYQKLLNILKEEGLEKFESVGSKFNPEVHEAIVIEQGDEDRDDEVIEEWQKGYFFESKLLRPAKVKVYKTNKQTE